jgi:hypothetical protein
VRGQYGWLGYGWLGCGDNTGSCEHGPYVRPSALDVDYSALEGHCTEQGVAGSGVFVRTRALVKMDCNIGKYNVRPGNHYDEMRDLPLIYQIDDCQGRHSSSP